jgi:hypothetical protein
MEQIYFTFKERLLLEERVVKCNFVPYRCVSPDEKSRMFSTLDDASLG